MPQPIALLEPQRRLQHDPDLADRLTAAATRVIASGRYILGTEVEKLEALLAHTLQAPHAIAVSSGTDALILGLLALDLRVGDQVLCPAYSFFASASTICRVGAKPVLVDVCPGCLCIDPHLVPGAINPLTRAIMPVHLYGQMAAMQQLTGLARRHRLAVVEDAAQAQGATCADKQAGSFGDVGCFSFFPSKNMGACGDAGLVVCHASDLAARMRQLRVHGSGGTYLHHDLGGNFRIDALQAALLVEQAKQVEQERETRQANARAYDALFAAANMVEDETCHCLLQKPAAPKKHVAPIGRPIRRADGGSNGHTFNQYVIRLRGEGLLEHVMQRLKACGIGHARYYPTTLAAQPALNMLGYRSDDFSVAHLAAQQSLALPIYAHLHPSECERVAQTVIAAIASFKN